MNIMYIHGFGSRFDPESSKINALSNLGAVIGTDIDYTESPKTTLNMLESLALETDVDLLVGTSLGAWYASNLAWMTGLPFVAINPALNPRESLKKYLGEGVDHYGKEYNLRSSVIAEYDEFHSHDGLVLLDEGDEVFDSNETAEKCGLPYVMYRGGNHRFEHMNEALSEIEDFYQMMSVIDSE